MKKEGFNTRLLHFDRRLLDRFGSIHTPIYTSTLYSYDDPEDLIFAFEGKISGYIYGRQGNPTTSALEGKITQMEEGIGTICFSTGMASLSTLFISMLKKNDHIISSTHLFGNTNSLLGTLSKIGCNVSFVDATDFSAIERATQSNTRIIFVESIANPCTQIADLESIGKFCRQNNILYVVDNTLTSPYLFTPKSVGASIVMNSLSKYIAGHGNVLGGSLTDTGCFDWDYFPNIDRRYSDIPALQKGLTHLKKKGLRDLGATLQPDSAHRISTGAETLSLRMDAICRNALTVAEYLDGSKYIKNVYYPGISSHPQHNRARKLFRCFGGILTAEFRKQHDKLVFLKKLITIICSSHLGDNRTLALPIAETIYKETDTVRRHEMGINDLMVRFSLGIEDTDDLIQDIDLALNSID
jgi:O-acetylhomoserine (thiol)-lyase